MTRELRVVVLVAACALSAPARADHVGWVSWGNDLEAGLKQAKATRKPVLLVFSADS